MFAITGNVNMNSLFPLICFVPVVVKASSAYIERFVLTVEKPKPD